MQRHITAGIYSVEGLGAQLCLVDQILWERRII